MRLFGISITRVRKNALKGQARARGQKSRRKRSKRNRLRILWTFAVIGILFLGGWGFVKIEPTVTAWTTLQQITVLGLDRVRREEVIGLLHLPKEESLLDVKTEPLIVRLEEHPWISSASIERVFPDTLAIRITEREAVAVLQTPDSAHLLDEQGYVLSDIPDHPLPPLPIVQGFTPSTLRQPGRRVREQARHAIQVAKVLTEDMEGVPTVNHTPPSTVVADFPKTRFLVGSLFDEQWQRFRSLYPSIHDRMKDTPKEIDLRYPGKVILRERK